MIYPILFSSADYDLAAYPLPDTIPAPLATFTCGRCINASERYRAVGDVPRHAHLCTACWEEDPNRDHYVKVTA